MRLSVLMEVIDFRPTASAIGSGVPYPGEAEGVPDRGRALDAGPCTHVHRHSAQASGSLSDRIPEGGKSAIAMPLSILYRKDLQPNGSNPALLNAYGAYGYSLAPGFTSFSRPFLEVVSE